MREGLSVRDGWAKPYAEKLVAGETVSFRPRGNSMTPRIKSGQLCTVEPLVADPEVDDVVLCFVRSSYYLHLVKSVDLNRGFLIGNNHGRLNGWVNRSQVYGRLVKVEA